MSSPIPPPVLNLVSDRLRYTNPVQHRDCIMKIQSLANLARNLREAIDQEARQVQAMQQKWSLNLPSQDLALRELGKTSPEVQRLKIQNYALQNQLKAQYIDPDVYFKLQAQPRKFEEQDRKKQQIRTLKKQLQIVRLQCLKASQTGINYLDAKKYQRLTCQNQMMREFLNLRRGVNLGDIPPPIQKIIGLTQEDRIQRGGQQMPEVFALAKSNQELKRKIEQFNQEEKVLVYQIQLRQSANRQARVLNEQLKCQYKMKMADRKTQRAPFGNDLLQQKVAKMEAECARLRSILQMQTIQRRQKEHQLKLAAQRLQMEQQLRSYTQPNPTLLQQPIQPYHYSQNPQNLQQDIPPPPPPPSVRNAIVQQGGQINTVQQTQTYMPASNQSNQPMMVPVTQVRQVSSTIQPQGPLFPGGLLLTEQIKRNHERKLQQQFQRRKRQQQVLSQQQQLQRQQAAIRNQQQQQPNPNTQQVVHQNVQQTVVTNTTVRQIGQPPPGGDIERQHLTQQNMIVQSANNQSNTGVSLNRNHRNRQNIEGSQLPNQNAMIQNPQASNLSGGLAPLGESSIPQNTSSVPSTAINPPLNRNQQPSGLQQRSQPNNRPTEPNRPQGQPPRAPPGSFNVRDMFDDSDNTSFRVP